MAGLLCSLLSKGEQNGRFQKRGSMRDPNEGVNPERRRLAQKRLIDWETGLDTGKRVSGAPVRPLLAGLLGRLEVNPLVPVKKPRRGRPPKAKEVTEGLE
jgi:hypothetical protein